jgi:hypothetical protein
MNQRTKKLLLDVAKQFEDASAVMHHDWLVENKVTLDEVGGLCSHLGMVVKGYVQAPKEIQMIILACGAADSEEMADMLTRQLSRDQAMKSVLARLNKLNKAG